MRSELARLIVEVAGGEPFTKVFFTNGGADANEYAVWLARHSTGRNKVLSTLPESYHGVGTLIGLTGDPRRWANEAAVGGVAVHFFALPVPLALPPPARRRRPPQRWSTWSR